MPPIRASGRRVLRRLFRENAPDLTRAVAPPWSRPARGPHQLLRCGRDV